MGDFNYSKKHKIKIKNYIECKNKIKRNASGTVFTLS